MSLDECPEQQKAPVVSNQRFSNVVQLSSGDADERQNGQNDNNGSDEPNNAVHVFPSSVEECEDARPIGACDQERPIRFRIAITMTTAPTSQTMLFIFPKLPCVSHHQRQEAAKGSTTCAGTFRSSVG
ncbi:hypothetical protein MUU53_14630 [Rhizobium lemnae]|uniref:Uncharacterized protein n=1 Tax=Rhizobium lemnae TaxID=1214924 RepID=A0ABV8E5W9_9HYPH|nr:hypothetical protein [Rhizobium lemnae]MCJ8509150.1 hypothetical protein [Rhizobium lemnae]